MTLLEATSETLSTILGAGLGAWFASRAALRKEIAATVRRLVLPSALRPVVVGPNEG